MKGYEFSRFIPAPREGVRTVSKYDLDGYDCTKLWIGKPLSDPIPTSARLTIEDDGSFPDFLYNPINWLIFSNKVCDVLIKYAREDVEIFPAYLSSISGEQVGGYGIVNLIKSIECLDFENSNVSFETNSPHVLRAIHKYSLALKNISSATQIFRLKENPATILWRSTLIKNLAGLNAKGFLFQGIPSKVNSTSQP